MYEYLIHSSFEGSRPNHHVTTLAGALALTSAIERDPDALPVLEAPACPAKCSEGGSASIRRKAAKPFIRRVLRKQGDQIIFQLNCQPGSVYFSFTSSRVQIHNHGQTHPA